MNGADRLCDALLAHGVDVCFANPGTSEMHFVAALDRKPEMRCILGLFEGVVTGAADGYGRMTDKPAVTLLHTGPGLANGLANLHNARRARSPVINVVGDHASYHLKFDAPLTSDIESLARPMCDYTRRIKGPNDVAAGVKAAWRAAMTNPGVSTLILPADSAWGEAKSGPIQRASLAKRARVDGRDIRAIAKALREARGRGGILLGGRALRADCVEIADRLRGAGIRIFGEMLMARMERGGGRAHVERIPYPVEMALDLLDDIDVLALVGAAPPVAFFGYPGKPSALTRDDCNIALLAKPRDDVKRALEALADELGVKPGHKTKVQSALPSAPTQGALTDDAMTCIVANLMPENAIVCDEALTSMRGFFQLSKDSKPHDYLMVDTGGAIGAGIPAAVGAAVACPDRKVIGLQADGSGMYTVQGLWTQARENLDIVTIVFANRTYAILHLEMRNVGVNDFGRNARRMLNLDEPALDWVMLARGMGVEAGRAATCEDFTKLLRTALSRRGPFLIEAVL